MGFQPEKYDAAVRMRGRIEHAVITAAVDALLGAGFRLAVWYEAYGADGGIEEPTRDRAAIMDALMACDVEWLTVFAPEWPALDENGRTDLRPNAFVLLVYGNDGWDVMSDYSTSLEQTLKPALDLANAIEEGTAEVTFAMPAAKA